MGCRHHRQKLSLLCHDLATSLLTQFPVNESWDAAEDGSNAWVPFSLPFKNMLTFCLVKGKETKTQRDLLPGDSGLTCLLRQGQADPGAGSTL